MVVHFVAKGLQSLGQKEDFHPFVEFMVTVYRLVPELDLVNPFENHVLCDGFLSQGFLRCEVVSRFLQQIGCYCLFLFSEPISLWVVFWTCQLIEQAERAKCNPRVSHCARPRSASSTLSFR